MARLLDCNGGKLVRALDGLKGQARVAAFIPGKPWCVVGGGPSAKAGGKAPAGALDDCAVRVWDFETGKPVRRMVGHAAAVESLTVSADGASLLTCGSGKAGGPDQAMRLWEVSSGKEIHRFSFRGAAAAGAALSPDGGVAVAHANLSNELAFWDIRGKAAEPFVRGTGHLSFIRCLCFAPDSARVYSADNVGSILAWTREGKPAGGWKMPGRVKALAPSPDGRHLATANADGTVYILRVGKG
jgi:WD40 repeat protein